VGKGMGGTGAAEQTEVPYNFLAVVAPMRFGHRHTNVLCYFIFLRCRRFLTFETQKQRFILRAADIRMLYAIFHAVGL